MKALLHQLRYEMRRFAVSTVNRIETVFIGGGTPSTVSPEDYEQIFIEIRPFLSIGAEVTVEANPNSATVEWLEGMHSLGVNRVSFGVQSFNSQKLKFLNRNHTSNDAIGSIEFAGKIGFKRISIDLIYNTIIDTPHLIESDIDMALKLPIEHISTYSLTIESGTHFETIESFREDQGITESIIERLNREYGQYEISNFGVKSRHNLGYWQGKSYIGVGSGAVGFHRDRRFYSNRDLKGYITNPIDLDIEKISPENQRLERLFLGLRSVVGVSKSDIVDYTILPELLNSGILIESGDRFYNQNYLLADEVALRLGG
jgi:oxygen-independent coproporphyrinogen-3 oxidase